MTNYEYIKNMSEEEMAKMLSRPRKFCCYYLMECPSGEDGELLSCKQCCLKWLAKEKIVLE